MFCSIIYFGLASKVGTEGIGGHRDMREEGTAVGNRYLRHRDSGGHRAVKGTVA